MMLTILRWVFFVPLGFLVSVISARVMSFLNDITLVRMGVDAQSTYFFIHSSLTVGLVTGYSCIYSGTYVAPKHKKEVALILLILIVLLHIYSFKDFLNLDGHKMFLHITSVLSTITASIVCYIQIVKNELFDE